LRAFALGPIQLAAIETMHDVDVILGDMLPLVQTNELDCAVNTAQGGETSGRPPGNFRLLLERCLEKDLTTWLGRFIM
jgi:hypothetical protein